MARPEEPIDPSWPLADFAGGLRALRKECGITYREMARLTHYGVSTLSSAANGRNMPTLEVTRAYVFACDGVQCDWDRRWQRARNLFQNGNGGCRE